MVEPEPFQDQHPLTDPGEGPRHCGAHDPSADDEHVVLFQVSTSATPPEQGAPHELKQGSASAEPD